MRSRDSHLSISPTVASPSPGTGLLPGHAFSGHDGGVMLLTASTGCLQSLEASQVLTSVPEGATQEAHVTDPKAVYWSFQNIPA